MNIYINGKPAEITLENESTFGDVISGIEKWISPSGNRIQKINMNGKEITAETLEQAFSVNIEKIEKLDILISAWRELAAEALGGLYETCIAYGKAAFDERGPIYSSWENSSAARFLFSDIPEIHNLACRAMSGEGLPINALKILIEERLREISDPGREIEISEAQVKTIAARMEELPLDMQTGKDQRAAETVQLFSQMGEKLFRIFFIQKTEGLSLEALVIDDLPAKAFVEEFNAALGELSKAYENHDTILVGDIAEYELAPRLVKLYTALKDVSKSGSTVLSAS